MTEGTRNAGRRWKHVAAMAALLTLLAYLALEHRRLTLIQVASTQHASQTDINALQGSIDSLQERLHGFMQQPATVTVDRFDIANKELATRLSDVERTAKLAASSDALKSLDDQVRGLTDQIAKLRRVSTRPRTGVDAVRPDQPSPPAAVVPDPPFTPLTVESRGGEQFLVVIPAGSHSVARARLLRVGDTEQGWRLRRIDARTAEFQIEGQLRRLALP